MLGIFNEADPAILAGQKGEILTRFALRQSPSCALYWQEIVMRRFTSASYERLSASRFSQNEVHCASIGLRLTLEINSRTGQFVPQESNADTPAVLIKDEVERIIDLVERIAFSAYSALMSHTIHQAVEVMVGHLLADIEDRLVMCTLRYFDGDLAQTAFALGIEETELITLICRHLVDPVIAAHPDVEESP